MEITLRTRTQRAYAIVYVGDKPEIVGYSDDREKARKRTLKKGSWYRYGPVVDGKVTVPAPSANT